MRNWRRTIDINQFLKKAWNGESWKFEEIKKAVINQLENDVEFKIHCEYEIEQMKEAEDGNEFDEALKGIYDYADFNDIWMGI